MTNYVYKIDYGEPESARDYAIRYSVESDDVYAKTKGGKEFKTDFKTNNHAFDVYLGGILISKKEYESF